MRSTALLPSSPMATLVLFLSASVVGARVAILYESILCGAIVGLGWLILFGAALRLEFSAGFWAYHNEMRRIADEAQARRSKAITELGDR